MSLIHLLDGTRDQKWGEALLPALAEIAKYQTIKLSVRPGSIDLIGYYDVKRATNNAFNPSRNQIKTTDLREEILRTNSQELIGKKSITLIEQDLYFEGGNWCYGSVSHDNYKGIHIVLSTYRMNSPEQLTHITTHELGHMFGAAPKGRIYTEGSLGSHCTNSCIMEQKLSEEAMHRHYLEMSSRKDKFCSYCQNDLRAHRK